MIKQTLYTLILVVFLTTSVRGDEIPFLSKGQILYAPAYSQVSIGNRDKPFLLTVTLVVRNVDVKQSITLKSVDYYDSQGRLLKKYLSKPLTLKPLSSSRHVVPRDEKEGGSGAGFLLSWASEKPANPPLVETVMIGAESQQGISFTSRAQVIHVEN